MTDKRPETDADILSRSRVVGGTQLRRGERKRSTHRYTMDLSAHMAECEANYARLVRLFPDLREKPEQRINLPLNTLEAEVVFEVLEKGPYTTLLQVEVHSAKKWLELAAAPAMTVRIYHDAQSAEVVSYQQQNRFHGAYEYPNTRMRQRDEKVQLNRFLSEFLTLCLEHGTSTHLVSFRS